MFLDPIWVVDRAICFIAVTTTIANTITITITMTSTSTILLLLLILLLLVLFLQSGLYLAPTILILAEGVPPKLI